MVSVVGTVLVATLIPYMERIAMNELVKKLEGIIEELTKKVKTAKGDEVFTIAGKGRGAKGDLANVKRAVKRLESGWYTNF